MQNMAYTVKNMNKRKAIIKFCVISVLVLLGLVLCFVEFTIPFTNAKYVGCFNAIKDKMGIDLNGGILAVYDVAAAKNSKDLDTEVNATIHRIENTLSNKNYLEATVIRQGNYPNYKIRIEVPGMEDSADIMEAIGEPANIEFLNPSTSQITSSNFQYNANDVFMSGEDIAGVAVISDPNDASNYVLKLTFTNEGKAKFRAKVKDSPGQYLAICSNENFITAPQISTDNASTLGADGTVLITGTYTKAEAEAFALKIESGLYSVELTPSEISYIPATLGEGAVTAGLISLVVGLLIIFVIMTVVYRDFGLLANLSLLIYTIIFLFLLALIDAIQLTLPGIAGIILSIGMAVDANILIFEQIKEEYRSGKRFAAAVHTGFNKSAITILDANITTIIVSVILYFLSSGSIKGFAITLALGVAISMFTGLVIMRALAKLYLYVNPDKVSHVNIKEPSGEIPEEQPVTKLPKRKLNLGGAE